MTPATLTPSQAAARLGVSERTLTMQPLMMDNGMIEVKPIKIAQNACGDITIKIPRSYLRHAVTISDDMPEGSRVTNTKVFSDAVLSHLELESEDGSNPVHLMLDAVITEAVEQGCEGIMLGDDDA